MREVLWLVQNTLRVFFKKKKNIIFFLIMPLVGIFIAFLAYGGDQKSVLHIGIVNDDHGKIAADTVQFLQQTKNVKVTEIHDSQVHGKITSGSLDCVVKLDKGFSSSVLNGNPGNIKIISIRGADVTTFVKANLYQFIDNIVSLSKVANGDQHKFSIMYQHFTDANFKLNTHSLADTSKNNNMSYQSIGFLLLIMLISAGNMSEMILSEKENRTYLRLLSAPINARMYILSNTIVNLIIMIIQVLLTLLMMTKIFHITMNIPAWEALIILFLFALIAIAISLMVVAFSSSRASASSLQTLIYVLTCMIAGCYWPAEIMPKPLQKIADFLPQRWVLETLTKLQEGHTFSSLYMNLIILFSFAAAFLLIAIYRFSRNNNARNFV
ncbi:ABC transporter permease [Heyndrickxia ginsengihumi]|uniref:ABC transporter permease n=1 Tax=Heyndrickxia ginsengihumi TaxID=363870 RepID=UPI003D1B5E4A